MKSWRDSTDVAELRAAVVALKLAVEEACFECRDNDASDAHEDLIAAEWRLRQAEKRLT